MTNPPTFITEVFTSNRDYLTGETATQMSQRDRRNDQEGFFMPGGMPTATPWTWGLVVVVMVVIWWETGRRPPM